jgi:hypothetical protein
MALSVRTTVAGGGTSGTGNRTVTITPAVGDLFVVFCNVSVNTNGTPTCSDGNGGTYSLLKSVGYNSSANTASFFVRNTLLINTTSTVITVETGSNTSGSVVVYALSGSSRTGQDAIVQTASQSNQAAGTTPAPTFFAAAQTSNMTLGGINNLSNPAALTPPTSWTEDQDVGQATPAEGLETVSRASGFTGTTITWGGTSPTAFASLICEINASATPPRKPNLSGTVIRSAPVVSVLPLANLLLTTLAVVVAVLPPGESTAVFSDQYAPHQVVATQPVNLLTSTLAAAAAGPLPPGKAVTAAVQYTHQVVAAQQANLLTSTLAAGVVEAPPGKIASITIQPVRQVAAAQQANLLTSTLAAVEVLPPGKTAQITAQPWPQVVALSSLNLLTSTLAVVTPPDTSILRRPTYQQAKTWPAVTAPAIQNLLTTTLSQVVVAPFVPSPHLAIAKNTWLPANTTAGTPKPLIADAQLPFTNPQPPVLNRIQPVVDTSRGTPETLLPIVAIPLPPGQTVLLSPQKSQWQPADSSEGAYGLIFPPVPPEPPTGGGGGNFAQGGGKRHLPCLDELDVFCCLENRKPGQSIIDCLREMDAPVETVQEIFVAARVEIESLRLTVASRKSREFKSEFKALQQELAAVRSLWEDKAADIKRRREEDEEDDDDFLYMAGML